MLTCICARLGGRGVRACGPVGEIEYCVETRDRTQRRERTEPGGRAGPGRGARAGISQSAGTCNARSNFTGADLSGKTVNRI